MAKQSFKKLSLQQKLEIRLCVPWASHLTSPSLFLHLKKRDNNSTCLIESRWGFNKIMHGMCFEQQCLAVLRAVEVSHYYLYHNTAQVVREK